MKLGIMQPYFFPYLGYFSLIKHTDKWVVFDTPQYIRHGWIERNRILKPDEGWQYIKVPLKKHSRETAIRDVQIRENEDWGKKILAQLEHYKKKAPFYKDVTNLLKEIFSFKTDSIVELDVKALKEVCKYLDITFECSLFSKSDINIGTVEEPDEWALEISKALGADEYLNLPGGKNFFDKLKYERNKVKLYFLNLKLKEYDQGRQNFESGLSIIDVMMFNSVEEINSMLNDYALE